MGAIRCAGTALVVVVGTVVVLATGWAPLRVRGARLAGWVVTGMTRAATAIFGVRVLCDQPERLRLHRGFVFPNHVSFVDILVLLHLFPLRFLSNHVVERTLFVGWVAKAIGTVFVDRRDPEARAEGRIGEGEVLHPLRRGAFEVAAEGGIPYLLCAIRYSDLDTVHWRRGEPFFAALWRLARHRGPLTARLAFLGSVHPTPADDPDELIGHAESLLGAAIAPARGDATAGAAGP